MESGKPGTKPADPLVPYNDLLGQLFPGYSFVEATHDDLSLKVQLPTGNVIPFQDLSSGEKEVFFILSFFIGTMFPTQLSLLMSQIFIYTLNLLVNYYD
jgi:hypothetical protein